MTLWNPAETSEQGQEMKGRSELTERQRRSQEGAQLRLPEGVELDSNDMSIDAGDDGTMIINMGPQHPSTHGVLRLMMELDGETVLRTKPIIGYLHTGMEKTAEDLMYIQGGTNVTRMDYLSPLFNEAVFLDGGRRLAWALKYPNGLRGFACSCSR